MKAGDKVVFVGSKRKALREQYINRPKKDSIVTLKSKCFSYSGAFNIVGYELDFSGSTQSFYADNFRPLDYDFVEQVLANIKEKEFA